MSTLRAAQKQLTRRLLLDSAMAVFDAKGYTAATIDDIASGAGTTRTTFYLHFGSKPEVLNALLLDIEDRFMTADDPPLSEVVASADRVEIQRWLVRQIDRWPELARCYPAAHQAAASDPDIQRAVSRWFERATADIVRGFEIAGRFDEQVRHLRASMALTQLEYLSRRWFSEGWTTLMRRDAVVETLTDAWCHALGA